MKKNALRLSFLFTIALFFNSCSDFHESKTFYPNGKLKSLSNFLKNNLLDSTIYFENGRIHFLSLFKIDSSTISKEYDSNGMLIRIDSFDYKRNGIVKIYFKSGRREAIGYYLSDTIVSYKIWDENGNLKDENQIVDVKPEHNSVKIGEYYNATITFLGEPLLKKGEKGIVCANIIDKTKSIKGQLVDSIAVLIDNKFNIHLKVPATQGSYPFICVIIVRDSTGKFISNISLNHSESIKVVK